MHYSFLFHTQFWNRSLFFSSEVELEFDTSTTHLQLGGALVSDIFVCICCEGCTFCIKVLSPFVDAWLYYFSYRISSEQPEAEIIVSPWPYCLSASSTPCPFVCLVFAGFLCGRVILIILYRVDMGLDRLRGLWLRPWPALQIKPLSCLITR